MIEGGTRASTESKIINIGDEAYFTLNLAPSAEDVLCLSNGNVDTSKIEPEKSKLSGRSPQ